ncbi:MAG: pilus assembly protein [Alphaproteobacteria bacterium]|nr:pilus assembly protein [Alphaproteobacteria bacterium]
MAAHAMRGRRAPRRRFLTDAGGGVLIETAVILPILVFLLLGGFEAGRYFLMGQKMQRAAMTVADLASRTETLTAGDVDDLFAAAAEVSRPFPLTADGRVLVSSIVRPAAGGDAVVAWQRSAGAALTASAYGAEGETATVPDADLIKAGQSIIAAEVAIDYRPVLFDRFPVQPLYAHAAFRPRFSKTVTLE